MILLLIFLSRVLPLLEIFVVVVCLNITVLVDWA